MLGHKYKLCILFLAILLLLLSFGALFYGRFTVPPAEVFYIFGAKLSGKTITSPSVTVVWDIRLSRVLLNLLVGGGLAAAGAAYQAIFQNRLVSPDILGVSNGAGFGAALAMLLAGGTARYVTLCAFSFGILSVALTWLLAQLRASGSVIRLVLSGIIVSSLFNALISIIKLVADTNSVLPAITYWLMGSFAGATFQKCGIAAIPICIGLLVIFCFRGQLNLLSLGDEEAYLLGVNPKRSRLVIIAAATLITAGAVTVTGIIGWIGMIIPNLCRSMIGSDHKRLIPACTLLGATFLVAADFVARTVTAAEIPIGILTALVGAPVFAAVFSRKDAV